MVPHESHELSNPFCFADGTPVLSSDDWQRRRLEIRDLVVALEYGGLPPVPPVTRGEMLHVSEVRGAGGVTFQSFRVHTGPGCCFTFLMTALVPPGEGPFPVVVSGDACWRYVTDQVAMEVLRRGMVLVQFNRTEIAPDVRGSERDSGIYPLYPGGVFGALAAWAWGYHRCIDALVEMPFVDRERIGVVGHSRGGKASLLAGATDERIALTGANNSGCGGAGSFRWQAPGAEALRDILGAFPYWFGPQLPAFIGRDAELPFDQHLLKALVAPRALYTTEALGDLWANPSGTWQTHRAAREVFRFLGAEDRIGIAFRAGGHDHGMQDWCAFLDFMDCQLCGRPIPAPDERRPFAVLPPAFSWETPPRR